MGEVKELETQAAGTFQTYKKRIPARTGIPPFFFPLNTGIR
jgi:hypothetical protein